MAKLTYTQAKFIVNIQMQKGNQHNISQLKIKMSAHGVSIEQDPIGCKIHNKLLI